MLQSQSFLTRSALSAFLLLPLACRTSTMHVPPDSARPAGADSYGVSSGSGDEEPGGRAFPACADAEGKPLAPVPFPASSGDADYRAIVQITIGPKGEAQNPCFRAVEGPLALEEKALAERASWTFDPAFVGQKRDRTVTYRLRR